MEYKKINKYSNEIIILIPIIYFFIIYFNFDLTPKIYTDSVGYINFDPVRTLGYPILTRILGLDLLVLAQLIIFCMSLTLLGLQFNKVVKNLLLTSILLVLICMTPELLEMQLSILTESFFTSLIIIIISFLIVVNFNFKLNYLILISIAVGLAAIIRPVGYGLIPVIIFFVLSNSKARDKFLISLLCILFPCLAIIGVERSAANLKFKNDIDSLMPRTLFAKSSMIEDFYNPRIIEKDNFALKLLKIQNEDAKFVRAYISNAPSIEVKNVLTLYYEQCIQYSCFNDEIYINNYLTTSQKNEIILRVALRRILNNPLPTFDLFCLHYKSLWTAYQVRHPSVVDVFNDYISKSEYIPYENAIFLVMPKKFSSFNLSIYIQPLFIFIGCATFLIALLYVLSSLLSFKTSPYFAISGVAALIVHTEFCVTAFFGLGISRYSFVFFPVIAVSVLFTILGFREFYLTKKYQYQNFI